MVVIISSATYIAPQKVNLKQEIYPELGLATSQELENKTVPECSVYLHIPKVGGRTTRDFLQGIGKRMGFESQLIYEASITDPLALQVNQTLTIGQFIQPFSISTRPFRSHFFPSFDHVYMFIRKK